MRNLETINELEVLIRNFLQEKGLDLVELIYRYEGRNLILRVLADRPGGGINLQECATLNNQLGLILEEKDVIKDGYTLEVSSPGLDRPLKTNKDFFRCMDREVRFFLTEQMNGKIEFKGVIREVKDNVLIVEAEGQLIELACNKIFRAKQIIE